MKWEALTGSVLLCSWYLRGSNARKSKHFLPAQFSLNFEMLVFDSSCLRKKRKNSFLREEITHLYCSISVIGLLFSHSLERLIEENYLLFLHSSVFCTTSKSDFFSLLAGCYKFLFKLPTIYPYKAHCEVQTLPFLKCISFFFLFLTDSWSNCHYIQFPSVHSLHNVRPPPEDLFITRIYTRVCVLPHFTPYEIFPQGLWPSKG